MTDYVGGPNDDVFAGGTGADSAQGNGGNDTLSGGAGGDTLNGHAGNDILSSGTLPTGWNRPWHDNPYIAPVLDTGAEIDTLDGGAGDDLLYAGYGDVVRGGADTDSLLISLRGATAGVTADFGLLAGGATLTIGTGSIQGVERVQWIEGSNFADTLTGYDDGGEFAPIFGMGGDDHLISGSGGGTGNLYGGTGNDTLDAEANVYSMELYGEAGNDVIRAGYSNAHGGAGNDTITLFGYTRAWGDDGNDIITASGGNVYVFGGAGADRLYGSAENDVLAGGIGADTIEGGAGNDMLYAMHAGIEGNGESVLDTGSEQDVLNGGAGDDMLSIGYGDSADGGDGIDSLAITTTGATEGLDIHLVDLAGGANVGGGIIRNVEKLDVIGGTAFDDVVEIGEFEEQVLITGMNGNDRLSGTTSSVYLLGGLGADILGGSSDADALEGNGDNDVISGGDGDDSINGGEGDDLLEGGLGEDRINGGTSQNFDAGIDTVTYANATGAMIVNLSTGLGSATGADGLDYLDGIENAIGSGFGDTFTGSYVANVIDGGGGDDVIDGREGADTLRGGLGNDRYFVDELIDTITEFAGQGTDTIVASLTFTLGANLENLTLAGSEAIDGTGNGLANVLTGNAAANRLDGKAGADSMAGGGGNDIYVVDNAGDLVTESAGQGTDLVGSSVTHALGANVENLTLTGAAAINGDGNGLDNVILGNSASNALRGFGGNDRLDGGAGADVMTGGIGDDRYVVDAAGDQVIEDAAAGIDTVESSISYTIGANVEKLVLTGTAAIDGTGNALDNALTGNAGANRLDGGAGADVMAGGDGSDTYVVEAAGDQVVEAADQGAADRVLAAVSYTLTANVEQLELTGSANLNGTGNGLANLIVGNGGKNVLNGGAGADELRGGAGDDRYIADDSGDLAVEAAGGGTDLVESSASFALGANIERLTLTGTAAINGTGNDLANLLIGNVGANILDGGTGADTMQGGKGDDVYFVDNAGDVIVEADGSGSDIVNSTLTFSLAGRFVEVVNLIGSAAINATGNGLGNRLVGNGANNTLYGMDGNDRLDGQGGNDTMRGGLGNDVFVVDSAGDTVQENNGEGLDTVEAWISYSLAGQYIESLKLMGTANINATGNGQTNELIGNAGNNVLNGQQGADILRGGGGNDRLIVDNAGDRVFENVNEGHDVVQASVTFSIAGQYIEELWLTGSAAIDGTGNSFANLIVGNAGANLLDGGAGEDIVAGGLGSDQLRGGAGSDAFWFDVDLNANNIDTILDYSVADDVIVLDRTIFTTIAADGDLEASAFVAGTAALDGDDRIVYDAATGNIWYDPDGVGGLAAGLFAVVTAGTSLSAGDFVAVP